MNADVLQQEDFLPQEYELSSGEAPPETHFPIVVFGFAVLKDFVIDPMLTGASLLSGGILIPAMALLGFAINFIFALAIFLWLLGKINFVQKRLLRSLVRRATVAVFVGAIPGAALIVPEMTILVLVAYNREKEIVKLFLSGLEKIEGSAK